MSLTTNVAGLRALTSPVATESYQTTDYGTGNWYYDPADTTSADNTGTILVSSNGKRFKRIFPGDAYSVAWFGAIGDGSTDDTTAIQNAIDYCYGINGGQVQFAAKTYCITKIQVKKGVGLLGAVIHPAGVIVSGERATVLQSINATREIAMVTLYPDHLFTQQTGEETGLAKSIPNIEVKNIFFTGNGYLRHCVYISEAWNISFDKCKFKGSASYALHIFDCNNLNVFNCAIYGLHLNSCADYNVSANELYGTSVVNPYLFVNGGYGVNDTNKIFQDPLFDNSFSYYDVTQVDATGLFSISAEKNLVGKQNWELSGANNGTMSFDSSTAVLTTTVAENKDIRALLNNGVGTLVDGTLYRLRCQLLLTGTSATRTVKLSCGNETQLYQTIVLTNGVANNVDFTFTFNPPTPLTNPLKLIVLVNSAATTIDTVTLSNLIITGDTSAIMDKMPVITTFNEATIPAAVRNLLVISDVFYLKYVSSTTFKLALTYKDWVANTFINFGGAITFSNDCRIGTPTAVLSILASSKNNTFNNNKVEDVYFTGILLRGSYGNVLTGNTVMKADAADGSCFAMRLEGGSSENVVSGSFIGSRNPESEDDMLTGIYVDKYSFRNRFSGLVVQNCRGLDIEDNYAGTSDLSNVFDRSVLDNSFVYQAKPNNYQLNSEQRGYTIAKNTPAAIIYNGPLINDEEFTVVYTDVSFKDNLADVTLFKQDASALDGRINIKRATNGSLYVTSKTDVVYSTTSSKLVVGSVYEIVIMRNALKQWFAYIDGVSIPNSIGTVSQDPIPTSAGVLTYIGDQAASLSEWSVCRFRYFTDLLSDVEVKTLLSSRFLDKNPQDVSVLLNSDSGTGIFSSNPGLTLTAGVAGITNSNGIQVVVNSANHALNLNESNKNAALRVSMYVKSADTESIRGYRGRNKNQRDMSASFIKNVFYLRPDPRESLKTAGNTTNFVFGKQVSTPATFGISFEKSAAGTIIIDKLRLWKGTVPVLVDLDLKESTPLGIYHNQCSSTVFPVWNGRQDPGSSPAAFSITYGIDAKATGATPLFTVPAGKKAFVTGIAINCTASSAITGVPSADIGVTAGDILSNTSLTGLTGSSKYFRVVFAGAGITASSGTVINLNINTAAVATTMTISVTLIGYVI
jgi:parallel beta-helix repeat protein